MSGSRDLRSYVSEGFPLNVFGLIALAVVIGLVLIAAPAFGWAGLGKESHLSVLVRDLGIAVFVSGFLAGTFDFSFRRRTAKETEEAIVSVGNQTAERTAVAINELRDATNDAVRKLSEESEIVHLKRQMGDQMFSEILRYLSRPTLRKNHELSITVVEAGPDQVTARCTSKYDVENISDLITSYDVEAYLEDDRPEPKREITSIRIAPPGSIEVVCLDRDAIQSKLVNWVHGHKFSYRVDLPPRGTAKVEVQYEFTCKVPWRFPWMIPTPQDGITVTMTHPPALEVDAWVSHPDPAKWTKQPATQGTNGVMVQQWVMSGVFLPYQSVQLSWEPAR